MIEAITELFLVLGAMALLSASLGVCRFPDFIARLHASGLAESLALPLALIGYSIAIFPSFIVLKLLLILAVHWVTAPMMSYLMVRQYS